MAVGLAFVAAYFLYHTVLHSRFWLPAMLWLVAAVVWWRTARYGYRFAAVLLALAYTKAAFI
jgi:hypothetical protein